MLIIVTTIPTAPTTVSIIYVPFVKFPIRITSDNTGSSQNVPILAKGEPLTVLAAPTFIIRYRGLFSYEFLKNKYTKFSILELAIFTDLDFVHFLQSVLLLVFSGCSQQKGSTGILRRNLFMLVFTQLILKNVLDQTVVKITVTETVHPGWTG